MAKSDPDAGIPRYLQIRNSVRSDILSGVITDFAPSENELADCYGVSRMTARKAVEMLVNEGLLHRESGRGTFVTSPQRTGVRTHTLAILFNPHVLGGISNPFYAPMVEVIERESASLGYSIIYTSAPETLLPQPNPLERNVALKKVDGVIAVAWRESNLPPNLSRSLSIIFVDSTVDTPGAINITSDDLPGMRQAMCHLTSLGHTRIAYLGAEFASTPGAVRLEGYMHGLREANLPLDMAIITEGNWEFRDGYDGAQWLIKHAPDITAIVCAADIMAIGAMRFLYEAGLRVPQDISVVGFGDIVSAVYVSPALTTVVVPKRQLGCQALEALLAKIEEEPEEHGAAIPTALQIRESSAAPRQNTPQQIRANRAMSVQEQQL